MIITRVDVFPIATRRIIKERVYARSLFYIIKIHTDEGIVGIGEASDILHHEAPDVGFVAKRANKDLVGKDPTNLHEVEGLIQGFSFAELSEGFDIALHDLLGKFYKVPLYKLLGGKVREKILIAFPLWAISKDEEIDRKVGEVAYMIENRGVKAIRIYVGANPEVDKGLLKALRDAFGYGLLIRSLDGSNRFTAKKAIRFIKELERYEFMYFESPCPDLKGMAEVRRAVDTPISQHVGSPERALEMIESRSVDILNISISGGGFYRAKKLFTIAEAAGVECVVGTTQELNIGTAAQAHLIASTPNIHYPCDPAGPLFYEKDVVREGVRFEDGELYVPEGLGLGLEIDEERLKELLIGFHEQEKLL
ncbi:MAG: mandelate racemase/muconate lactonizing enzyme family protein [Candidatus Bathyarchaeia archaeon]